MISLLLLLAAQSVVPAFREYPAVPSTSRHAPLVAHGQAHTYRTEIRRQMSAGANFGGHFVLIQIGCGAGCTLIAVGDEQTGVVTFPPNLRLISWADWWHEPAGAEFREDSRLLIVHGRAGAEDAPTGISYYEWRDGKFALITFVAQPPGTPPDVNSKPQH